MTKSPDRQSAAGAEKIGVLGGSFNPVHNGHVNMAVGVMKKLGLDRVLMIPVWSPPHKSAREMIPAADRVEMCRLACEGRAGLGVSGLEVERGGRSYTVDTLRSLSELYPGAGLFLITGADMFLTLEKWKSFDEIARLSELCGCARRPGELEKLRGYASELEGRGARCRVVELEVTEVSSTEIRRLLSAGRSVEGLVPERVREYISGRGLYSASGQKYPK